MFFRTPTYRARPKPCTTSAGLGRRVLLLTLFALGISAALAQQPSSPQVATDVQQAEAALRGNQQDLAARLFQGVLQQDPGNVEAHANLGAIAFFHGDCAGAMPNLRAAFQSAPTLTKVQALLAICERRQGDPASLADMEAALGKLDDPKLRLQLGTELANAYYQAGDLERTAATLHTLLNTDPENVDILFFAQRVYSELADNTLNKLAVLSPNSARMEQLIAERLINAGDLKAATAHYRKALALNPRLPGMHFELAEALMEASPNLADTQKEAAVELAAATEVDGDNSRIESELGRIALLQSKPTEAFDHYGQAIRLNPADTTAQMGLAELLRVQNKPADAAVYLRQAVKADPFNAEAHYKLSQVDRQLHLDDEAKQQLQLFLDLRSTRDKVQALYRQMNPAPQANSPAAATP